ncbi:MAG: polysaccharide biosynthesis protein [Ruminococcaceae bacterium]|nr:polysaccharide biosynthesis protein [Oscillospiraceae bacterium]
MDDASTKNIRVGAILTYLTQFLSIAISFVYVPIMLKMLGQAEYGLYSIVQSLISYLQMSEMGIGTTATRYNSKYIAQKDENGQKTINGMFFKLYLGIAAVCIVIATVLFFCLDGIYAKYAPESIQLIKTLFVIAVLNLVITFVFKIFNAIVIAYEEYIFLKVITLIQTILGPVGMLSVLFLGCRSIGMLCVTTALSLLFGLIQMFFCLKKYHISFSFRNHDPALFRKILSFTLFVFINSLATQLMMNSDKLVISIVMTEYAVAVFAIVMQFHTYSYNFANVLSGFYLPKFTKNVVQEKGISPELMADVQKTGRIQVLVAGLIFGGFLAIGKPFILRWVGPEYMEAYWLTVIVLITETVGASQSMFNSLMQAMNLHKTRALLSLAVSGVKIVLTVIFTIHFGLLGCAVAFFLGWLIKQIVFNRYYHKKVGIDIPAFWKQMGKLFLPLAGIIAVLSFGAVMLQEIIPAKTYLILAVYAACYSVLYLVLAWLTVLNQEEKREICKILQRFRR